MSEKFNLKQFITVALIASLWIQVSEVFRYFIFVMPNIQKNLLVIPGVAPMDLKVFLIWGIWDTLLTFFNVFIFWLYAQQFGNSVRSAIAVGTISWTFFVLFWVAMVNMALSLPSLLLITLLLSWFEMVIASLIASWLYRLYNQPANLEQI